LPSGKDDAGEGREIGRAIEHGYFLAYWRESAKEQFMTQLQALIFDLDGTLIDSAPDLRQALNVTLQAEGRRALSLEEVKSMTGDGLLLMMHRAYGATGASVSDTQSYEKFKIFIEHYRRLKPDPAQIYPHVVETLTSFQTSGVKLGLCTNKQEAATHQFLGDLNLARFFSYVAGGDTFPVHKPHPGHVMGVLDKLGVLAGHAVMIGDSTNDILSAQGAGVKSIAVAHGYGADVENLGADIVIGGFDELKSALTKLGF
jgi:phosphoglycolate phosphatase